MNIEKKILALNFKEDKIYTFSGDYIDSFRYDLENLNKKGFNIYISNNSFYGGRKIKDIAYFLSIGIDLDEKKLTPSEIVGLSKNKLGITPSKINETFKGYHISYNFHKELNLLSNSLYVDLYKKINQVLGGDKQMKDITGILKIEGFNDNKDKRNFIIKTVYKSETKLKIDSIKNILNKRITFKRDIKDKIKEKIEKKERNDFLIEDVDALSFIKEVSSVTGYKLELKRSSGTISINDTTGLKIFFNKDKDIHQIKDFSKGIRMGNKSFFFNYIIKELGIEDKDVIFKYYLKICNNLGIKLSKKNTNILVNKDIISGIVKMKVEKLPIEVKEEMEKSILKNNKEINYEILKDGKILKLISGIYTLIKSQEKNHTYLTGDKVLGEKELLQTLGLSVSKHNKEILRKYFIQLNGISVVNKIEDSSFIEYKTKFLFETSIVYEKKTGKVFYKFKNKEKVQFYYIPENILMIDKGFGNTKKTKLTGEIMFKKQISGGKGTKIKKDHIVKELGITSTEKKQINRNIKNYFEELKKLGIIGKYEVDGNYFKVF